MTTFTITRERFSQIKKLMSIARSEQLRLYRTKSMICELLPPVLGIGHAVDEAVDLHMSPANLLRRLDVVVKRPKKNLKISGRTKRPVLRKEP